MLNKGIFSLLSWLQFRIQPSSEQESSFQEKVMKLKEEEEERLDEACEESLEAGKEMQVCMAPLALTDNIMVTVFIYLSQLCCSALESISEAGRAEEWQSSSKEKTHSLHHLPGQHPCYPLQFPAAAGGAYCPPSLLCSLLARRLDAPCHPVPPGTWRPSRGGSCSRDPPQVRPAGSQPACGGYLSREAEAFQWKGALPEPQPSAVPPPAELRPAGGLQEGGLAAQAVLQSTVPPHSGQGRQKWGGEDFWRSWGLEGGEGFEFWSTTS